MARTRAAEARVRTVVAGRTGAAVAAPGGGMTIAGASTAGRTAAVGSERAEVQSVARTGGTTARAPARSGPAVSRIAGMTASSGARIVATDGVHQALRAQDVRARRAAADPPVNRAVNPAGNSAVNPAGNPAGSAAGTGMRRARATRGENARAVGLVTGRGTANGMPAGPAVRWTMRCRPGSGNRS
jgi:hypothetical protein